MFYSKNSSAVKESQDRTSKSKEEDPEMVNHLNMDKTMDPEDSYYNTLYEDGDVQVLLNERQQRA